jgi:hypothetical protein
MIIPAYQDIKSRFIDDRIWLVQGVIGYPLLLMDQSVLSVGIYRYLANMIMYTLIFIIIHRFSMIGEADIIALMMVFTLFPLSPVGPKSLHYVPFNYPLRIFLMTLISALIYNIMYNLLSNYRYWVLNNQLFKDELSFCMKVILCLIARKEVAARIDNIKIYSLEVIDSDGLRRIRLMPSIKDINDAIKPYNNDEYMWTTSGIPLISWLTLILILYPIMEVML